MAVPGRPVPEGAPADLAQTELFAVDAYLRDFEARVESVDAAGHRVRLARTAFYPGGGGQPHATTAAGSGTGSSPAPPCPTPPPRSRESSTGSGGT